MKSYSNQVKFGVSLSNFSASDIVKLGGLSDRLGYRSVWIPDHLSDLPPGGDRYDPWVLLSAIGVNTKGLELFTGVTDPIRMHPAKTANIVATLDELTNGRAGVGIGTGEFMNLGPYGLGWEENIDLRIKKLEEAVFVIRKLFTATLQQPFSFKGQFFALKNARLDQRPVHDVRIYLGSLGGRRTLKLVGEVGDGWFPVFNTLEGYKKRCQIIDDFARAKGRDPRRIDRIYHAFVILSKDVKMQKKSVDAMKPLVLALAGSSVIKEMSERGLRIPVPLGNRPSSLSYQHMNPTGAEVDHLLKVAPLVPDDIIQRYVVAGGVTDVAIQMEPFIQAGARHIVFFDVISMLVSGKSMDCATHLKEFAARTLS